MIFRFQQRLTSLSQRTTATRRIEVIARSMTSSTSSDEVQAQTVNGKGIITLNRPKALNSLSMGMIRSLYSVLKDWEKQQSMVIIKGAGEKAFCTGGDIRQAFEVDPVGLGKVFFREEYTLNSLIGTYHVPYIALIDGITMGGGVGVSVHGKYRVATERTVFAMPETAIGLFPDVGGSYFLPRLGGKLGLFLALTGNRLKGIDVLKAGIATHYCESSKIPELEKTLIESSSSPEEILKKFSSSSNVEFSLKPHLKQIDDCFCASTVEGIFENLEKEGTDWALKVLATLKKMSPTSMKVTKKELEEGSTMDLQECLQMEYRLSQHCLQGSDFYEGVRALLIDKDQKPTWKPPTLQGVTDSVIDKYFEKLAPEEELVL